MSDVPVPQSITKLVAPFTNRAKELDSVEPIVAYYCKLYAVETILGRGLHNDPEISGFATTLLDDIEVMKNELQEADPNYIRIIEDKSLSSSYITNFALKIFNSADGEQRAHISDKTTASKLITSSTFLELLKLFEEDEPSKFDWKGKVKYAKFHGARILKAIRNNEDPNDFKFPEEEIQNEEKERQLEAELNQLDFSESPATNDLSLPETPNFLPDTTFQENMGLPPPPSFAPQGNHELSLPSAPKFIDNSDDDLALPTAPKFIDDDNDFLLPTAPKFDSQPASPPPPPVQPRIQRPPPPQETRPIAPVDQSRVAAARVSSKTISSPVPTTAAGVDLNRYMETTEVINKAQKHAKFAISALNYEDIETSVKELNNALELLNMLRG